MNAREAVDRGLLEQYAPVLRYHEQEPLRADSPAIMANAALAGGLGARLADKRGTVLATAAVAAGVDRLDLAYLAATYPSGRRAAPSDRIVPASGNWQRDAAQMRRADPLFADRIYGQAVQENGAGPVWLQYWFFYYFNDKGLKNLGDHDGDWECIQLRLDAGGRPDLATAAQHAYGERREYRHVKTVDDDPEGAPIFWVALGSHASYFESGNYRIKRLPVPAPIFDLAKGKVEVRPAVERVDRATRWVTWPGRWGAAGGPQGPLQHGQFRKPATWHASKRVDNRRKLRVGRTFLVLAQRPPEPLELTARVIDGGVDVAWRLPALHADDPVVPVRVIVSVRRARGHDPAITESLAVQTPEGSVRLALPPGSGALEAALTTFDAEDRDGPLARVTVSPPPAARRGARAITVRPEPPSRPPRPARAAASLRLLVRADGSAPAVRAKLKTAVDGLLDVDAEGAPWRVAPLFPRSGGAVPERLRPFWTVSGRAPETGAYPFEALAFDLARQLADATGFEVHPDLPSAAFEPPTAPVRTTARARRKPPPDWAHKRLGLDKAAALEPTLGAGVVVAQPDTGVTAHPAIAAVDRARDADVIDGDDDATDPLEHRPWWPLPNPGHGTRTASVILGPGPAAPFGAAPQATLVPIRAVSSVVQVFDGDVALAVDHARRIGADVITMSLGGDGFFGALRETIRVATDAGIIVMAAGGNVVWWVTAPARFDECLAVAAVGPDDKPWARTSDGPEIDWSAPGADVWAARTRRERGKLHYDVDVTSGSSYAVAHSAGVAARWVALHGRRALRDRYGPSGIQWAFRTLAQQTARRPAGWKTGEHGAGILDAEALLNAPLPPLSAAQPPRRRARAATGRSAQATAAARLAPLLREVPVAEIPGRIEERLGVAPAALARFAGELAHHLVADPVLREAVAAPRRTGARAAQRNGGATARARLDRVASLGLRDELRR